MTGRFVLHQREVKERPSLFYQSLHLEKFLLPFSVQSQSPVILPFIRCLCRVNRHMGIV